MSTTQYTLRLLTEYAYTLDSLPLDLSRNLADLRELDAVLSATITAVTNKVNFLVDAIEGKVEFPQDDHKESRTMKDKKKPLSKEERVWSELEAVAREAKGLKLGSEDKIKVASQTADLLANQQAYLSLLLTTAAQTSRDPSFNPAAIFTHTAYPHLPALPPVVDTSLESSRRKRAATTRGLLSSGLAPTVNGNGDERRERERERERERDRGESPTKKRRHVNGQGQEEERSHHRHRHGHTHTHTHHSGHRDGHPSSRKHRQESADNFINSSNPQNFSQTTQRRRTAPTAGMLDDFLGRQAQSVHHPHPDDDDGDRDGDEKEGDDIDDPDKVYCICGTASWGEMLACDDEECKREWFHLSCLGLAEAPRGSFYCDECRERKAHRQALERALANANNGNTPAKRSHKRKERVNGI